MSKKKKMFSLGIILSFLGIILITLGLLMGAKKDLIKISNDEQPKSHTISKKLTSFNRLTLNLDDSQVIIKQSNDNYYHLSYTKYDKNKTEPFTYQITDNQLTLSNNSKANYGVIVQTNIFPFILSLFGKEKNVYRSDTVTLAIPKNSSISKLSANLSSSYLTISNQTIDQGTINLADSFLNLTNCQLSQIVLKTNDGRQLIKQCQLSDSHIHSQDDNLTLKSGQIQNTSFELSDSSLELEKTQLKDAINLDMTDSNANFNITSKKNLSYTLDTSDSSLTLPNSLKKLGQYSSEDENTHFSYTAEQEKANLKITASDSQISLQ